MSFTKSLTAGVLSLLLVLPAAMFSASAASDYSNDFSETSLKDFDTTTANALIKDGTLQLKKGDGDAAVILKTEKYENFTLEVDITVTDPNEGGAPFLLYHTQEANNPFSGGTYTAVIYPTDVKGCFFAPYSDNGWIRQLQIYEGNATFHIKLEVYDNHATFYAGDTLLGSFDSGLEHESGYIGLGSYKAAVSYDNLKVTPSAPVPGKNSSKGRELVSDDFSAELNKKWISKTMGDIDVSGGKMKVFSGERVDRYALYSENMTESKYMVETALDVSGGNSGLLVKGGFNAENAYEGYSFTYDKENNLMKASRYHNGYLSIVEKIRVAPLNGEHTMTVCVDGSRHAMYVDGNLILEFIDSTFNDGSVGYMAYNGTGTFDNLKVYAGGAETEPTNPPVSSKETEPTKPTEATDAPSDPEPTKPATTAGQTNRTDDDQTGGLPGFAVPLIILGVLVVLGGGGTAVYFIIKKKKAS